MICICKTVAETLTLAFGKNSIIPKFLLIHLVFHTVCGSYSVGCFLCWLLHVSYRAGNKPKVMTSGWDSVDWLEMFSTTATAEDIRVGQCWQTWNVHYHCYCWRHQGGTVLTDLKCSVPLLLLKTGWDSVDRLELFSTTATAEDIRVGQCWQTWTVQYHCYCWRHQVGQCWQTWNARCHCFSGNLYSTIIICVAVVIIWQDGEWSQKEIHGESAGRLLMPQATATTFSSPSSSVLLLFHRAVNEAKSEDTRGETILVDLRRQYHCYSYNLLIAIITCVQNEAKFYKGFLFQDNVAKVRC